MDRRRFVATTATSGLAAWLSVPASCWAAATEKNELGLQLYTVRNQLAEDRGATLEAIAEAGYKQVELSNVMDSGEIVKHCSDLGLRIRSAFFNWETISNPASDKAPKIEEIIDRAKDYGLEYLVFGYIGKDFRNTADKMKRNAEAGNAAAEKIVAAGMQMSYHNHSFEFEQLDGGKSGFDILMEHFDSKLVNFELDVFWAKIGGENPIKLIGRLGDRLGQVHLKDLAKGHGVIYDEGKVPADAFQEVGDGTINMKRVVSAAVKQGVKQFHVEQDQSPDPIASINQSFDYARKFWS